MFMSEDYETFVYNHVGEGINIARNTNKEYG
jgi:hypothetical protein